MRRLLLIITFASAAIVQTRPNIGLNVPVHGTLSWGNLMNTNMYTISSYPSGGGIIPGFDLPTTGDTNAVLGMYNPADCGTSQAPSWCSGSDIGAWTNAAITQLPVTPGGSHCGTIYLPAGSWKQSTTIVKPRCLKLDGAGGINTNLLWNGAKSTYAIVVADTVNTGANPEGAIEDLTLSGLTSSSGGIFLGGDPGTNCGGSPCSQSTALGEHQNINRVRINGFAVGVAFGNNAYSIMIFESALFGNVSAISVMTGAANSGENIVIQSSSVNNNKTYAIYVPFPAFCPAWCFELINDSFDVNGNGTTDPAPIQTGFVSINCYFIEAGYGPFFDATTTAGWVADFGSTFTMVGPPSSQASYFGKLTSANNSFVGSIFNATKYANTDLFTGSAVYNLSGIQANGVTVSSKGNNYYSGALITGSTVSAKLLVANQGTAQTTKNIVLTGWGSGGGSVALSGPRTQYTQYNEFTITTGSTGYTSNPTVAVTFSQAFSSPPVCTMNVNGITGSGGAIMLKQSSWSASSTTFTAFTSTGAAFTPAAGETYTVVMQCGL
jgi:hypothetical protein